MKRLERGAAQARADRPASAVLHDEANARVVEFRLQPGQRVPPHRSGSTVLVVVVDGRGSFEGAEGAAARLGPGEAVAFEPGESHGIVADQGVALGFLAVIAPRPG